MSMFGTTQGSFQNPPEHKPIIAPEPSGAVPGKGVLMEPVKTGTISPAANKLK